MLRGDADLALRFANTIVELSRDREMPLFLALGRRAAGWARAQLGEREAGIAELQGGLTAYTEQGNKLYVPFFQGLLAELEAEDQDQGAALTRIEEALAFANRTGEHWTNSFLHRIRGEILLKRDPANTALAEEEFLTAISVARAQQAKSWELRAAMSLARLWRDQGKPQQARELLAPVYGWFTEGFDTLDLKEAKVLLEELAS